MGGFTRVRDAIPASKHAGDEGCLDVVRERPHASCFRRVAFLGVSFDPPESSL
jgi:hypothetical protein